MDLIDTHCHLTSLPLAEITPLLEQAAACSVNRVICIGASEGVLSATQAVKLAETYPAIWASIGIHPHDAGAFTTTEQIEHLAVHKRVVAIGETGLDFFRDWAPRDAQFKLFQSNIALARKVKKPLIIHCRDAAEECFSVLKENKADEVGGVFHCYAEDASFAERLSALNFIVSFTGNITFKKADAIRKVVNAVPLERLMLETDTPYMAPEPFRGKPSQPMHVYQIARVVAEVKKISIEQVAAQTTKNAERLFSMR